MPEILKSVAHNTNWDKLLEDILNTYTGATITTYRRNINEQSEIRVSHASVDDNGLDTIITNHNPATLTTTQQNQQADNTELANLLSQANAGLNQIEADIIALQAATTLPAVRPIVDNILTRQRQIIRTLCGIVRSKLS